MQLGTITDLIPFVPEAPSSPPFVNSPHVHLWFSRGGNGDSDIPNYYRFYVATGSCGIITPVSHLNALSGEPRTPGAYQFFTSSNTLYTGLWIWRWVWYNKGTSHQIKAHVQVLAVENKYICPGYVIGVLRDTCPGGVLQTPDETITIMGMGTVDAMMGRNGPH